MTPTGSRVIRIGSRGSQLALWQANFIADALRGLGHEVAIQIIRTTGDHMQSAISPAPISPAPGGKGIFAKEIEDALLAGTIDLAVHSLKDLPTEISPAFTLAAIPPRADARDVLVSQRYASLSELPHAAVIGTGSPRRRAQLLHQRPDLTCVDFRGNVDTRLNKLAQGRADAIILAAAGLERLEKTSWVRERFAPEIMCPAAGQGALALECRSDDAETQSAVAPLEDSSARLAVTAERAFLAAMGGGCEAPIGAYCHRAPTGELSLLGVAASSERGPITQGERKGADPVALGKALARQLLAQSAEAERHHSEVGLVARGWGAEGKRQ